MIAAVTHCKDTVERARSNALQEKNHSSYPYGSKFWQKNDKFISY